jgi:hypothetical protein
MMIILETLKFLAEVITSVATAIIVIIHLVEFAFKLCNPMKIFFKTTVPLFFKGFTDLEGKKIRFFRGLKRERERMRNIINAVAPNREMENILVLDEKTLLGVISNSKVFYQIRQSRR